MDIKQLRSKSLSSMNTKELQDFISKAESKGFEISKSKELNKAVNLLKVKEPSKYGKEQIESAKKSLTVASEVPTLQKLGITNIPDWKLQEQAQKDQAKGLTSQASLSGGQSMNMGTASRTEQGIPTYVESNDLNSLEEEYNQKRQAYDRAATDINDNPFFSEATRVGKQTKLEQQKARELNTLTDRIAQIKADDQLKYNISMDRYKLQQAQVEQNIQRLNTYISTGAILNATAKDLAQIGVATGMSQSMLQGIINNIRSEKSLKNAPKTMIKDYTDDEGNVSIIVFDERTGQPISQNKISGIGKTSKSSAKVNELAEVNDLIQMAVEEANYTVNNKDTIHSDRYLQIRQFFVNQDIGDLADFDRRYQQYVNPNFVDNYDLYAPKDKKGTFLDFSSVKK